MDAGRGSRVNRGTMNLPSVVTRRTFLTRAAMAAAVPMVSRAAVEDAPVYLSTNAYSWGVFFQRDGRNFGADLDRGLAEVKESGVQAYEPGVGGPDEVRRLIPLLAKHGLDLPSIYVNSTLHDETEAARSQAAILAIAEATESVGTRIFVTNPNPIRWGAGEDKTDAQLRVQAASMNRLGEALRKRGITLAYHNHDVELRQAAREFHHMMNGTDPDLVSLCLDSHWIYRGSGNSSVALFDVVRLYGSRVVAWHLRQSQQGVWSETLGDGDLDYPGLARLLHGSGARPLLVLEIAVENGTPKTLTPLEAHRQSAAYARRHLGAV